MVIINFGYTAPINRPGDSPRLSLTQVWEGLRLKTRYPEQFVPIIVGCEILDQKSAATGDEVITRMVNFAPAAGFETGEGVRVKEVCYHYAPCRADFEREDGSKVFNFVSVGSSGEPDDLFMTFVFESRHPEMERGSYKAVEMEESIRKVSRQLRCPLTC